MNFQIRLHWNTFATNLFKEIKNVNTCSSKDVRLAFQFEKFKNRKMSN